MSEIAQPIKYVYLYYVFFFIYQEMSSYEPDSLLEVFTIFWVDMNVSTLHIIYGIERKLL